MEYNLYTLECQQLMHMSDNTIAMSQYTEKNYFNKVNYIFNCG